MKLIDISLKNLIAHLNLDSSGQSLSGSDIAIGYDYVVNSGSNFASVMIIHNFTGISGVYELSFHDFKINLSPGVKFDFISDGGIAGGVSSFRIEGIDPSFSLDPFDPLAFETSLTFLGADQAEMSQIPLTTSFSLLQNLIPC